MGHATSAPLLLTSGPLRLDEVDTVVTGAREVAISAEACEAVRAARRHLEHLIGTGETYYGINTGFGSLSRKRVESGKLCELQHNLIRSHAAGVGEPFDEPIVRGMMLLLAASLARGASGVRLELIERLVALLNTGVTPVVPSIGSVGASGDLAPLAHVALVLIGEGEAWHGGRRLPGGEALANAGLKPITLEAKEGLALINGTHLMGSRLALLMLGWQRVFAAGLCAAAMSIDATRATDAFLAAPVYELRNHSGPALVAERMRELLQGSTVLTSHLENDPRVQDPYSIRCAPVVLGAALDAARYVRAALDAELGAVTDNPLLIPESDTARVVSAGNFHGMPVAIPLDALCVATAHVAGISERRTFLIVSAQDPESHLTPYLSPLPGLQSGLMIAQYTAAACVNEIVGLCTPASVSNVVTSAGVEDYNSFGPRSAAKAARALDLTRNVVAIELVCAAAGLEFHRPLRSGKGVEAACELVRSVVPPMTRDRPPGPDVEAVGDLIARGAFVVPGDRLLGD